MTDDPNRAAEPSGARARSLLGNAYAFLVSPKLAIAILVLVLACCLAGVTIWRYDEARKAIFSTLWFNALLVLLAVSSGAAFFSRIWKRKLTLLSVGMIVFHVSFAALLGGVVYNSLFRFRGMLRLTEGETLPNGERKSYDSVEHGRLFGFDRLRGETTLVRVHRGYQVDGRNKRMAYEIEVGEAGAKVTDTIYIARGLVYDGVRFICWHEGYSVLLVMSEPGGGELYGGYLPLQSLRQPDGKYLYASGTWSGAAPFLFPPAPEVPRAELLVRFRPNTVEDRKGDVTFELRPLGPDGQAGPEKQGRVTLGEAFDAGAFKLEPREVRYWVTIEVSVNPGLGVILGSLCSGLGGMMVIFVARVRQGSGRARRSSPPAQAIAVQSEETVA